MRFTIVVGKGRGGTVRHLAGHGEVADDAIAPRGMARCMIVPALLVAGLAGCQEDPPVGGPAEGPADPAEAEGLPAASPDTEIPSPPGLIRVPTDTVQDRTGPGGEPFEVTLRTPGRTAHLHARIGRELYPLPLRTTDFALTEYPCASCHVGTTITPDRTDDAHDDIQPVHPSETGAVCTTCHVADSVELLALPGERTASLDHAYRLCAQCHASETEAWAAGIHGKRLEGWHGRRVVMNCADCHDPHRPALETRIPYPGPRIP